MPLIDITSRADASALIPEPIVANIFDAASRQSAVLGTFTRVNVPFGTSRMPVLAGLPFAYWQNPSDTGLREATDVLWSNKQIVCEELSVIVPIPRTVIADSQFDLNSNVQRLAADAIAYEIDRAVFVGGGQTPATFPTAVCPAALAALNNRTSNTTAANGGLAEDINQLMGLVESDGYTPTHFATHPGLRAQVRGARGSDGQPILSWSTNGDEFYGRPVNYNNRGIFSSVAGAYEALVYDASQFVVGVAMDMTMRIDESGVISSRQDGRVLTNLMQSNMIALILNMRVGWQYAGAARWGNQSAGTDEVQTVTISGGPTGGGFTVSYGGYTASFTVAGIPTAAQFQSALEDLPCIGRGNVSVARSGTSPNFTYTITFTNALGSRNVDQVTVAHTFTGGSSPNVAAATTTQGASGNPYAAAVLIAN